VDLKKPQWTVFGAERPANPIRRRRPVYLRLGESWVQVRTFEPEGDAFVGNVETITAAGASGGATAAAAAGIKPGDWVRFEQRHVFSACISHE
jgi:hypothetical protein